MPTLTLETLREAEIRRIHELQHLARQARIGLDGHGVVGRPEFRIARKFQQSDRALWQGGELRCRHDMLKIRVVAIVKKSHVFIFRGRGSKKSLRQESRVSKPQQASSLAPAASAASCGPKATPAPQRVAISPHTQGQAKKPVICELLDGQMTCDLTRGPSRDVGPMVASCIRADRNHFCRATVPAARAGESPAPHVALRQVLFQGIAVRRFRWLIIVVFFFPWLDNEVTGVRGTAGRAVAVQDVSGGWRRTREGWQRIELLRPAIPYRRPALHPAVVGSLEVLLTMTAMLALSANNVVPQRDTSGQPSPVAKPQRAIAWGVSLSS